MKRKIDSTWASQPGCKGDPLFNVPLENVLIDELHLLKALGGMFDWKDSMLI